MSNSDPRLVRARSASIPGWVGLAAGIVLLGGLGAVGGLLYWLPIRNRERRSANEGSAFTSLKVLASAEADMRANDRDQNGIQDYWTRDLSGLYSIQEAGAPIRLIDHAMAEADARPLVPLLSKPVPKDGYYFIALEADDSVRPPETYAQETDRKSGPVHHLTKFAFLAYPAEPGVTGNYLFMIDQDNTVYRASLTVPLPRRRPNAADLVAFWTKPS